jgi:hypothetical protein
MAERTDSTDETMDGYFGLCPICHKTDGYLNVGNQHWFVCEEHKVKWFVGENLFSSWMYETPGEQSREQKRLEFHSFVRVEPFYPPAERPADMQGEPCDARGGTSISEARADEADELDTVAPRYKLESSY